DALQQLGVTPVIREQPLATFARDRAALERAVAAWKGVERHFRVSLTPDEVTKRVAARLAWLPAAEREYWEGVLRREGSARDTLRFLALSLDGSGRPIPIVNTDPAMALLLDSLGRARILELVGPTLLPYPVGLFVDDLGPVTANDAYAGRDVWEAFRRDAYHSPTVVWGRDVNALLAGLFASNIGSEHFVGLAGTGAASGLAVGHFEWLACFMLLRLGWLFVPFYLRSGVYTMPEFLERRFNPAARAYFTWVSIIGYVLTKISVTLFAGGIVMREVTGYR